MKKKPEVGQTLYCLKSVRRIPEELKPVIVTSVGRKYFKASSDGSKGWKETEFHLDTWVEKSDYTPTLKMSGFYAPTMNYPNTKDVWVLRSHQ